MPDPRIPKPIDHKLAPLPIYPQILTFNQCQTAQLYNLKMIVANLMTLRLYLLALELRKVFLDGQKQNLGTVL